jgi:hypothetical protein
MNPSFIDDLTTITRDAKLPSSSPHFLPTLHLRKRSIEECRRVEETALKLYFKLVEERDNRVRKLRGNAWDHIYLGILEDAD